MPPAWRDGEMSAPPRSALVFNLISAQTSYDVPKITEDYSHALPEESRDLWAGFVANLVALEGIVEERNLDRPHPFRSFDTSIIETSVGI
mmetsp:Transcript_43457/g.132213  ORF Transcript_43457/g.132213 Transcript_43457/m.132213 type:complete len:90 (-) Transcript_43457:474-743(-)